MPRTRRKSDSVGDEIVGGLFVILRESPWWVGPIVMGLAWVLLAYVIPWVISGMGPFGEALAIGSRQFAWVGPLLMGFLWISALIARAEVVAAEAPAIAGGCARAVVAGV